MKVTSQKADSSSQLTSNLHKVCECSQCHSTQDLSFTYEYGSDLVFHYLSSVLCPLKRCTGKEIFYESMIN